MPPLYRACALLGLLTFVALPALASDGVIEINQARAMAGGVTPGDAAGFPVSINVTGSYLLTSDLDLAASGSPANVHGIVITAPSVSLDLNGFSIFGTTTCAASSPTTCSGAGTGNGIEVGVNVHVTVRNGTIRNVGNVGINTSNGTSTFEDLTLTQCGGEGLHALNSTVTRVQARLNGGLGIYVFFGSVKDSRAALNRYQGIVGTYASLVGNAVYENGGAGIEGNTCLARDNQATFNQGFALLLTSCSWAGNSLRFCSGGCYSGSGNLQLGPNDCGGSVCP